MFSFIIGLVVFLAVLLVLVILAQNAKGGGLSSQFGGSGASNIIGVKKTGDLLEKLTWGFMIAIMVLALTAGYIMPTGASQPSNDILNKATEQGTPPPPDLSPSQPSFEDLPADTTGE